MNLSFFCLVGEMSLHLKLFIGDGRSTDGEGPWLRSWRMAVGGIWSGRKGGLVVNRCKPPWVRDCITITSGKIRCGSSRRRSSISTAQDHTAKCDSFYPGQEDFPRVWWQSRRFNSTTNLSINKSTTPPNALIIPTFKITTQLPSGSPPSASTASPSTPGAEGSWSTWALLGSSLLPLILLLVSSREHHLFPVFHGLCISWQGSQWKNWRALFCIFIEDLCGQFFQG